MRVAAGFSFSQLNSSKLRKHRTVFLSVFFMGFE
jgi:hypothetical protein